MPYGEIFSGTFRVLWREKRLMLLSLLGIALTALGSSISTGGAMGWYGNFIKMMSDPAVLQGDAVPEDLMSSMALLFGGIGMALIFSFIGYFVNLVMRGGLISEAARAWQGERVEVGRGARRGTHHALRIFGLDVLWVLPAVLVIGGMYVLMIIMAMASGASGNWSANDNAISGLAGGGFLVGICAIICLAFLYAILQAMFAPLMFQSAVQADRGLGYAIKEGWALARANLGSMFIFALMVVGVSIAMSAVLQAAALPLNAGMMGNLFGMMRQLESGQAVAPAGGTNWLVIALGTVLYTVVAVLVQAFTQAFTLTLYATVYRRLADKRATALDLPAPAADVQL